MPGIVEFFTTFFRTLFVTLVSIKLITFVAIYPKRFVVIVVCLSLQQTSATPCGALDILMFAKDSIIPKIFLPLVQNVISFLWIFKVVNAIIKTITESKNQLKGSGSSAFRDVPQGDHSHNIRTHKLARFELL